ncbi:hypothetical protein Sango_0101100 [Sesamum angolense]|uniref:RNase H type-1 domain-containing protein n=1 Tax=Sesamum angolense TaxID=2727404 RepID=A0AAE1XF52_9LAMI|nr:hypothetical protein Sango_0101100 [Sesamum angolense]
MEEQLWIIVENAAAQAGTIKINFDGPVLHKGCKVGIGRVARDSTGSVLAWFSRKYQRQVNGEIAEALAAREAVDLAIRHGWNRILIEGDCLNLINKLNRYEPDQSYTILWLKLTFDFCFYWWIEWQNHQQPQLQPRIKDLNMNQRAIRRSLGPKSKLGFLTRECVKPWIKADCMVASWILRTISKDIDQAYMYTESAISLWIDLESRQRQVQLDYPGNVINTAMQVRHDNVQNFIKRKEVDKKLLCCDHCHKQGRKKKLALKFMNIQIGLKELMTKGKGLNEGAYTAAAYVQKTDARNQAWIINTNDLNELVKAEEMTLQDQRTREVLAIGKQIGNLHVIDRESVPSSHCIPIQSIPILKICVVLLSRLIMIYGINGWDMLHIILPTPTLNWKSPYELLYRTPPSYDHLKSFGCLCFASNVLPQKSKFDPRAFHMSLLVMLKTIKESTTPTLPIPILDSETSSTQSTVSFISSSSSSPIPQSPSPVTLPPNESLSIPI